MTSLRDLIMETGGGLNKNKVIIFFKNNRIEKWVKEKKGKLFSKESIGEREREKLWERR